MINHSWRELKTRLGWGEGGRLARLGAGLLTFLAVVVAWVFFRADSFASATNVLSGMAGINGISLPRSLEYRLAPLVAFMPRLHMKFEGNFPNTMLGNFETFGSIMLGLSLVWLLPNIRQIMRNYKPIWEDIPKKESTMPRQENPSKIRIVFNPNMVYGLITGLILFLSIAGISKKASEFLYFQF